MFNEYQGNGMIFIKLGNYVNTVNQDYSIITCQSCVGESNHGHKDLAYCNTQWFYTQNKSHEKKQPNKIAQSDSKKDMLEI